MNKTNLLSFLDKNKDGKIVKIKIDEITTLPELENAFHMDEDVKNRIKNDIAENGFNKAHAIHIFQWNGKWVLCDGHTRFQAAKEVGLKTIWAQVHSFESVNQALLYSMKEQFNRRNIEDSELFKQFEILQQEEINGKKLTVEQISEQLKKSKRHIFKLKEIFSKSTKEQLKAIKDGKTSINQVYNEIKAAEKTESEKQIEKEKEDDSKTENEVEKKIENISEMEIEKSANDFVQEEIQKQKRELQKKGRELKQKEIEFSNQLSDKEILLLGAKYALIEKAKGKSVNEILDEKTFDDSVKASNISFCKEDLELLKAI